MPKNITLFAAPFFIIFTSFLLSSCQLIPKATSPSTTSPTITPFTTNQMPTTTINPNSDSIVGLKTKNGEIVIKLYPKEAPNTVANFLSKIQAGFYNNLVFHRVEPGFVVQGGDPLGTGTGGGKIKSEINSILFKRGSVGLARTAESKEVSNDSQFFICLSDETCAQLTGEYVNFGEVISGFEVLDKIAVNDKILELTDSTK
ncbi:MAG: peptidylprolyl isomerase [Candidatus Shapirobacteria bacterium]|jgi:cyclophilin family peptidyl-prolyl cis-trans isomerase